MQIYLVRLGMQTATVFLVLACVALTAAYPANYYDDDKQAIVFKEPTDFSALPIVIRRRRQLQNRSDSLAVRNPNLNLNLNRNVNPNPRGSVGLEMGRQSGVDNWGQRWQTSHIRTDANYDFYRSRNGNTRLSGNGYYQRNFGDTPVRHQYGGGVTFQRRF